MAKAKSTTDTKLTADMRVVVLTGPEEMLRREKLNELIGVLEKKHGEVSRYDFDGTRASLADVMDEVRGYSLMGGYKVVVVDHAVHTDKDKASFVSDHRAALERYAESPVDHATLVLRCETWRAGNLDKRIAKGGGVIVKLAPLKEAEAVKWAESRAKDVHRVGLPSSAAQLLVQRMGTELLPLDTAIAKLAVVAGGAGASTITEEMIAQSVERSSDEKAWEVQSALLEAMKNRSPGQALTKVRELIDVSDQPEVLLMYFVTDLARKLTVASQMRRDRVHEADIGKALKLWGRGTSTFFDVSKRFDEKRSIAMLERALTLDAHSKHGLGHPGRNLERFCATLPE